MMDHIESTYESSSSEDEASNSSTFKCKQVRKRGGQAPGPKAAKRADICQQLATTQYI